MRIETPVPIPTWAWLIFLGVFAWGMWYLGIELTTNASQDGVIAAVAPAPTLIGNAVVTAPDPSEHILVVLNGLADKVIDGIAYPAPMPRFGGILTDEEIAAVVNHERTSWGHSAPLVVSSAVEALRQ